MKKLISLVICLILSEVQAVHHLATSVECTLEYHSCPENYRCMGVLKPATATTGDTRYDVNLCVH